MTNDFQHNSAPKHAKHAKKSKSGLATFLTIAGLILILAALAYAAYLVVNQGLLGSSNENTQSASDQPSSINTSEAAPDDDNSAASSEAVGDQLSNRNITPEQSNIDKDAQAAAEAAAAADAAVQDGLPTPLLAEYDGVLIHSPIHPKELEGILFHQAATEFGLVLNTQLPEADPDTMLENPDYQIADEQPTGDEWLDALALHLWREDTDTNMDTSIDVGAEAGTTVYAPVSGTVVLVKTYRLYDVVDDYEVHIQPHGRPDLDVVEIHVTDVMVKAGDKVEGGVTPIALVRDLAAEDITDIQLAFYSHAGHGNHTHVQVNNADMENYRETRLEGAYEVK